MRRWTPDRSHRFAVPMQIAAGKMPAFCQLSIVLVQRFKKNASSVFERSSGRLSLALTGCGARPNLEIRIALLSERDCCVWKRLVTLGGDQPLPLLQVHKNKNR